MTVGSTTNYRLPSSALLTAHERVAVPTGSDEEHGPAA
jgi:hypothetical protein